MNRTGWLSSLWLTINGRLSQERTVLRESSVAWLDSIPEEDSDFSSEGPIYVADWTEDAAISAILNYVIPKEWDEVLSSRNAKQKITEEGQENVVLPDYILIEFLLPRGRRNTYAVEDAGLRQVTLEEYKARYMKWSESGGGFSPFQDVHLSLASDLVRFRYSSCSHVLNVRGWGYLIQRVNDALEIDVDPHLYHIMS